MWFKNRGRKPCGACPRRRPLDNSLESAFEDEQYKIINNPHRNHLSLVCLMAM